MKKTTKELEGILLNAHSHNIENIIENNKSELVKKDFSDYFKDLLLSKNITQQKLFIDADISEKYGYKLISGEKHTNQRDTILRLCYAGHMNVEETNRVLTLYGMTPFYARDRRDGDFIFGDDNLGFDSESHMMMGMGKDMMMDMETGDIHFTIGGYSDPFDEDDD